jgi:hypothetical protein
MAVWAMSTGPRTHLHEFPWIRTWSSVCLCGEAVEKCCWWNAQAAMGSPQQPHVCTPLLLPPCQLISRRTHTRQSAAPQMCHTALQSRPHQTTCMPHHTKQTSHTRSSSMHLTPQRSPTPVGSCAPVHQFILRVSLPQEFTGCCQRGRPPGEQPAAARGGWGGERLPGRG